MANQNFRDMAWLVEPHVPGVPAPLMFYHLANACRRHLVESLAWQYDIGINVGGLDLGASTEWPTITAGTHIPTNTYVVQPTKLKWDDGTPITFKTRDQLDQIDGDWEQDASGTQPRYWTTKSPGNWVVVPQLASATTGQLYMRVAIAPVVHKATVNAGVDEFLAYEYREAWARGAMSTLMLIPGKDWTNLKLGAEYEALFQRDIKRAKSKAAADYGRPDRTVRYGGIEMRSETRKLGNLDDYGN